MALEAGQEGGMSLPGSRCIVKTSHQFTGQSELDVTRIPLGPVNMDLSDSIAKYRAEKLLSVSGNVMVACPLCYQNLKPYISNMNDLAEVIE